MLYDVENSCILKINNANIKMICIRLCSISHPDVVSEKKNSEMYFRVRFVTQM